jgi:hypothetical protein
MDPEDNSTANNDTGIPDGYIEVPAPYLEVEVEDVRPVDEQGDAEFWGIPEALTQYIFQFLTKKKNMLLRSIINIRPFQIGKGS